MSTESAHVALLALPTPGRSHSSSHSPPIPGDPNMRSHFRNAGLLAILLSAASVLSVAADLSSELAQLKTTKGICVVVAIETTDLPIKMVEQTELIIYVHSSNAEVVSSLRRTAASRGYLGTRI